MRPGDLPQDWLAWYEERAAILEFLGNMTRSEAEKAALWLTVKAMREVKT